MIFDYNFLSDLSSLNHKIYIFEYRQEQYLDSKKHWQELHVIDNKWYLLDCKQINSNAGAGVTEIMLDKGHVDDITLRQIKSSNEEEFEFMPKYARQEHWRTFSDDIKGKIKARARYLREKHFNRDKIKEMITKECRDESPLFIALCIGDVFKETVIKNSTSSHNNDDSSSNNDNHSSSSNHSHHHRDDDSSSSSD